MTENETVADDIQRPDRRYARDHDVFPKNLRLREDEKQTIQTKSMAGEPGKSIASSLGRCERTVLTYLKTLRLQGVAVKPPRNRALNRPETKPSPDPEIVAKSKKKQSTVKRRAKHVSPYSEARSRYRQMIKFPTDDRCVGISEAEFVRIFTQRHCVGCGCKGEDEAFGIDRLFPDLGYIPGNCASMCWQCNRMKGPRDIVSFLNQCIDCANYIETGCPPRDSIHWPFLTTGCTYNKSMGSAKRRNIPFALTKEEYNYIAFKPCVYCGRPPFPMHGVDRIDSTKGYIHGNCCTSCTNCNMSKKDMRRQEYVNLLGKIRDNATNSFDYVRSLRSTHGVQGGSPARSSHPLGAEATQKMLQVVRLYDLDPSITQGHVAKTLGLGERSTVSEILEKARIISKYNPEWLRLLFMGNLPTVSPPPVSEELTENDVAKIVEYRTRGMSITAVAIAMERNRDRIARAVVKLRGRGLAVGPAKASKMTIDEKKTILDLKNQGLSQKEIALRIRRSEGVISTVLKSNREKM